MGYLTSQVFKAFDISDASSLYALKRIVLRNASDGVRLLALCKHLQRDCLTVPVVSLKCNRLKRGGLLLR